MTYSLLKQEHLEINYFQAMQWGFLSERIFAFKNEFSQLPFTVFCPV